MNLILEVSLLCTFTAHTVFLTLAYHCYTSRIGQVTLYITHGAHKFFNGLNLQNRMTTVQSTIKLMSRILAKQMYAVFTLELLLFTYWGAGMVQCESTRLPLVNVAQVCFPGPASYVG